MAEFETVGFIGLGVMGEPMCRNLVQKSGLAVIGYDLNVEPMERLAARGVAPARSVAEVLESADVVLISLPSGAQVEALCRQEGGLLSLSRGGQIIVDLVSRPSALFYKSGFNLLLSRLLLATH